MRFWVGFWLIWRPFGSSCGAKMLPRASQDAPKAPPRRPKRAPRRPKMLPKAPKNPKIASSKPSRPPKWLQRGFQESLRVAKMAPRDSEESPKSSPRGPKVFQETTAWLPGAQSASLYETLQHHLSPWLSPLQALISPIIQSSNLGEIGLSLWSFGASRIILLVSDTHWETLIRNVDHGLIHTFMYVFVLTYVYIDMYVDMYIHTYITI